MRLLALDTATEALSVALLIDGALLVRESRPVRGHAELLLPMVDALLAEAGQSLSQLDAFAVGRGPGAFTGVRIGVSVAQGLAFATGRPIVGVSDLAALGLAAAERAAAEDRLAPGALVLAALDARLGGLYAAAFAVDAPSGGPVDLDPFLEPDERLTTGALAPLGAGERLVVAGHGWSASPALRARAGDRLVACYEELLPGAGAIARLAERLDPARRGVAPEALAPVYLRDDVATKSARPPGAPRP